MRFLTRDNNGKLKLSNAIANSVGVTDAGKLVETSSTGKLDLTLLPDSAQDSIYKANASEAIVQGNLVCLDSTGGVIKASSDSNSKAALGFALTAGAIGDQVTFQFFGINTFKTGFTALANLTPGAAYFLGVNGQISATPPAFTVGHLIQSIGVAATPQNLYFEAEEAVEYA
ncbi:MAG: hypothetical protein ACRC80_26655 [Waterburya sp.]